MGQTSPIGDEMVALFSDVPLYTWAANENPGQIDHWLINVLFSFLRGILPCLGNIRCRQYLRHLAHESLTALCSPSAQQNARCFTASLSEGLWIVESDMDLGRRCFRGKWSLSEGF